MKKTFLLLLIIFSTYLEANPSKAILGLGAPCVDIILEVSEEFLVDLNCPKGGRIELTEDSLDHIIEKAPKDLMIIATGGSASNTIKGLASLQQEAAFFGKIGTDEKGDFFINAVKKVGVTPITLKSSLPTTQVLCLVTPDKQRTFGVLEGAGYELHENDFIEKLFEGKKIVHIEGFCVINKEWLLKGIDEAKESGAIISFDMGNYNLIQKNKDIFSKVLQKVDIVFANEEEAFAFTGLEPRKACKELAKSCPIAVVKVGEKGCYVASDEGFFYSPAFQVPVFDTTGAGDLFASGFLFGLLQNFSLKTCANIGNFLGGIVVQYKGAEIPEYKWHEIKEELESICLEK